jgi:MFS family permease
MNYSTEEYDLWYAVLAVTNAALGFFFLNYNITIFAGLLGFLEIHVFTEQPFSMIVFIAAALFITAPIGTLLGGYFAKKFGRRVAMIISDVFAIIGVVLSLFPLLWMIILGRLIIGFAVGITTAVVPLYFTEIVPIKYRGIMVNALPILGGMGVLFSILLQLLIPSSLDTQETNSIWKVLLALPILAPIIRTFNLLVFFKHDTPFFYISKNKNEKAKEVLNKIQKGDVSTTTQEIIAEREHIKSDGKTRYRDLFTKKYRKAMLVCIIIMSLQYLSGINFILVYSSSIYKIGVDDPQSHLPNLLGVCTAMVNFITPVVCIYTTSHFGRKPLLVYGTFFSGVGLILYGIFGLAISPESLIPKIFLIFWPIAWNISLFSVFFLVISETLPNIGVPIAALFNWIFGFITVMLYPDARDAMGVPWTLLMFGLITVAGALFLWVYMIETRGKDKNEILKMYGGCESEESRQSPQV